MDQALRLICSKQDYEEQIGAPFVDSLTGVFNHGYFQLVLDQEIKRANRYGSQFALAVLDVDSLALFNERHGALQGDLLLRSVGTIIKNSIRQTDIVARYVGDSFTVLMTNTDPASASPALERIQEKIALQHDNKASVSIGVAAYPEEGDNVIALLKKATTALDQARTHGPNSLSFSDTTQADADNGQGPVVLLVDDEALNLKLMEALLLPLNYDVIKAASGREALDIINRTNVDLVLLDVMMPEMDGYEVCRRIKTKEHTRMIPVVLVTALDDVDSKVKGIESGADDFIAKPPHRAELIARTKSLIQLKKLNSNLANIETVLFSLANAVEAKDAYTQGHIERVSNVSVQLGHKLGLDATDLKALRFGGALHDIGKIGISEEILNKPGPLDPDERAIMQAHADIGYRICLPLKKNLGAALDIVRHHHEKMDGSGYPDAISGDEIPMVARIMAVADIYDALITDRPYRRGLSRDKAISILTEEAEAGKLDRIVVKGLIDMVAQ